MIRRTQGTTEGEKNDIKVENFEEKSSEDSWHWNAEMDEWELDVKRFTTPPPSPTLLGSFLTNNVTQMSESTLSKCQSSSSSSSLTSLFPSSSNISLSSSSSSIDSDEKAPNFLPANRAKISFGMKSRKTFLNSATHKRNEKIVVSSWVRTTRDFTNDSIRAKPLHLIDVGQEKTPQKKLTTTNNDVTKELMPIAYSKPQLDGSLPDYDLKEIENFTEDIKYIDTHCHLDFLFRKTGFKSTFAKFRQENAHSFPSCYEGCVAVFCQPDTFKKHFFWGPIIKEDGVWAAFGCHPHKADFYDDEIEKDLQKALDHYKVVALGEIGLDFSERNSYSSNHQKQKEVFKKQLLIAVKRKLPLVIHSRDSEEQTINIMKDFLPRDHKIHRHCFTGNWIEAKRWLDCFPNLFLGLTSLVTFTKAVETHEVAKRIPLERLLLETDAPYFLPRLGYIDEHKCSHPGMAIHVAAQVAKLRGISLANVLRETRKNTKSMYNI